VAEVRKGGEYALPYSTSPKKSYVVRPEGGEIDYSKYKTKEEIYEKLHGSPIKKYKM